MSTDPSVSMSGVALYSRLTDLLCLDASLVFHDTTLISMHSESDEEDEER